MMYVFDRLKNITVLLKVIILIVFTFYHIKLTAQQDAFTFVGSAGYANGTQDEILLTPNALWVNGSAWFSEPIDLTKSFSIHVDLYFGTDDLGADGIAFGLQTQGTGVGGGGGGIGMGNLSPLLAIEFDTYQNIDFADPVQDHVALVRDGVNNHNAAENIVGPVLTTKTNFEDGSWHNVKIVWNAATQVLDLYFECDLIISENIDIVQDLFSGQEEVFWGFTAATGGATNQHAVRINELSFFDTDTFYVCNNDATLLSAPTDFNGNNYKWYDPSNSEIGTSSSLSIVPLQDTGVYTVTFTQQIPCIEDQLKNYVVIRRTVDAPSLPTDTLTCTFPISIGNNTSNSDFNYQWFSQEEIIVGANNSVLSVNEEGNYTLAVTLDLEPGKVCSNSSDIKVGLSEIIKPLLGSDTSTCKFPIEIEVINLNNEPYNYQWLLNDKNLTPKVDNSVSVPDSGELIVKVDSSGCINSDTIQVMLKELTTINVKPLNPVCLNTNQNLNLEADPTGGIFSGLGVSGNTFSTINFSNSNDTSVLIYYDYEDDLGCESKDSISVDLLYTPTLQITIKDNFICEGSDTDIEVSPYEPNKYDYFWRLDQDVFSLNSNLLKVNKRGTYEVELRNKECTSVSNTVSLGVEVIDLEVGGPYAIEAGESQTLQSESITDPNSSNVVIDWYELPDSIDLGQGESITVQPTDLTEYVAIAKSDNGCTVSSTTLVEVLEPILIPEVITPNGDGANDFWVIQALDGFPNNTVKVFNRWGDVVFEDEGYTNNWEGTRNGELLPVATYYYYVTINDTSSGEEKNYSGSLTIIR